MNTTTTTVLLSLGAMCAAQATLIAWQGEVGIGTAAAKTEFSTISTPTTIDVTVLSGGMSFEFIMNAGAAGASQALLGDRTNGTGNDQALKFEQYNNTGNLGFTAFGVADWNSGVAYTTGTDIQIVFTSDGSNTRIYVNGAEVANNATLAIDIAGVTGIGGIDRGAGTFQDVLDGDILGFAAYDSELSPGEIETHYNAFVTVPEPSSAALLGLGGIALILRRRK